jgi:hypothetical protein
MLLADITMMQIVLFPHVITQSLEMVEWLYVNALRTAIFQQLYKFQLYRIALKEYTMFRITQKVTSGFKTGKRTALP